MLFTGGCQATDHLLRPPPPPTVPPRRCPARTTRPVPPKLALAHPIPFRFPSTRALAQIPNTCPEHPKTHLPKSIVTINFFIREKKTPSDAFRHRKREVRLRRSELSPPLKVGAPESTATYYVPPAKPGGDSTKSIPQPREAPKTSFQHPNHGLFIIEKAGPFPFQTPSSISLYPLVVSLLRGRRLVGAGG